MTVVRSAATCRVVEDDQRRGRPGTEPSPARPPAGSRDRICPLGSGEGALAGSRAGGCPPRSRRLLDRRSRTSRDRARRIGGAKMRGRRRGRQSNGRSRARVAAIREPVGCEGTGAFAESTRARDERRGATYGDRAVVDARGRDGITALRWRSWHPADVPAQARSSHSPVAASAAAHTSSRLIQARRRIATPITR